MTASVLNSYLLDCKVRQLSLKTIQSYREVLTQFTDWCGPITMDDVTPDLLRKYIVEQDHRTDGGKFLIYRYLRTFFNWWEQETDGRWTPPTRKVKAPRHKFKVLPSIPLEDVQSMVNTCKDEFYGPRDKAILLILLDTGVRANPLLNVDIDHVDATMGVLTVTSKGDKVRSIYLGKRTRKALRAWIRTRQDVRPLFTTKSAVRLGYSGLRLMLGRRAQLAGVERPTAHSFRRAFAITMLRSGVDIFTLARLMNHSDTRTLIHYLDILVSDIELAHRRHSPVDNL